MLVIAKSVAGHEFLYSAQSAHKIPKNKAEKVKHILNTCRYQLKDNETWYLHDVGEYDIAYDYATFQSFCFRKGQLIEKRV